MIRRAAAFAAAVMVAAAGAAAQTPTVIVNGPANNPIVDALGTFSVSAVNFSAADFPIRLQLQVSTSASFEGALFADTIVNGNAATITIPRLLPSTPVYWRAFALTARAGSIPSPVTGPRVGPTHLRLISPNNPAGQSLNTRRPTFVWSSSRVPPLFGRWDYELRIDETSNGRVRLIANTTDTTFVVDDDLESNASYRWRVVARLRSVQDSVIVAGAASFVITSSDAPLTTVLFNPFPSPFPSPTASRMCIWFDLVAASNVSLRVVDFRGLPVRSIVPGSNVLSPLPAGRYGRPSPIATSGCDDVFSWDGTDANNRTVPAGNYLIILVAGGKRYIKPVVFLGR